MPPPLPSQSHLRARLRQIISNHQRGASNGPTPRPVYAWSRMEDPLIDYEWWDWKKWGDEAKSWSVAVGMLGVGLGVWWVVRRRGY